MLESEGLLPYVNNLGPAMVSHSISDDPTDGLWFSIDIDGEEFIAFIATAALQIHFGAPNNQGRHLLSAYKKNQTLIDESAKRKFLGGAPRPIKLGVGDF